MAEEFSERGSNRGTVLVVDDDPQNQRLLTRLLDREGYHVASVGSGELALEAIDRNPPDLVLLDVQMPGLSGFEVCRRLKDEAQTRLTPVVLITAHDAKRHRIRGIQAGADDFLSKPINSEELHARVTSLIRVKHYTDQLDSAESIIISLGRTIEARDAYTRGHCERLAHYATALGRQLGLGEEQVGALHRGAYLHDIGKIGIPDAVLLKTSRLTASEYELMKQHTVIGEGLCGTLQSLALVRPIVRHHHERLDGRGYPDGLRGGAIPLLAQIVNIVDTYDAITTDRPYRAARAPEVAFAELTDEVKAGMRDGELVDAFVTLGRTGALAMEHDSNH
jgi:putative two-component system response regulator